MEIRKNGRCVEFLDGICSELHRHVRFQLVYTLRSGFYRFFLISDRNVKRRRQPFQFRHTPTADKLDDARDILRVAADRLMVPSDMV